MKLHILAAAATAALLTTPVLAQSPATPAQQPAAHSATKAQSGQWQKRGDKSNRENLWSKLSPAGQEAIKPLFAPAAQQEAQQKLHAEHQKLFALMSAEKLDVEAVRQEMGVYNKLMGENMIHRQQQLLAVLPKLSASDRQIFAKIAQRRMMARDHMGHMQKRHNSAEQQKQQGAAPAQAAPATK